MSKEIDTFLANAKPATPEEIEAQRADMLNYTPGERQARPLVANNQFGRDDFITMNLWSKEHWSTLAYIETKLVDNGGKCEVKFDARMRQNRRNYRVLLGQRMSGAGGIPMSVDNGTRLNDGTYLPNHDDWNCVQDMQAAGLFEGDEDC